MDERRTRHSALSVWRDLIRVSVAADGADLTGRQWAILLAVYLDPPPHTVRGLAAALGVGKPVVTRAVTSLERAGLLKRGPDPSDRRSVLIQRTVRGSVRLTEVAEAFQACLDAPSDSDTA